MRHFLVSLCSLLCFFSSISAGEGARRVLVTASNNAYFSRCLTLISSIHSTSFDVVDEILVYNLGLSKRNQKLLSRMKKVQLKHFEDIQDKFPQMDIAFFYEKLQTCCWKQVCVHDAASQEGDLIFWLDAGAMLLQSAEEIFQKIEHDEIFLVVDQWHNYTWTHQQCIDVMQATQDELYDYQLCAGIHGYKKGGRYQKMMDEALAYTLIKECVDGHKFYHYGINCAGEWIKGHRHDQSILSILASRYRCPKQSVFRYGEWRTLQHCHENDSVIWVHRGEYQDHFGILFEITK